MTGCSSSLPAQTWFRSTISNSKPLIRIIFFPVSFLPFLSLTSLVFSSSSMDVVMHVHPKLWLRKTPEDTTFFHPALKYTRTLTPMHKRTHTCSSQLAVCSPHPAAWHQAVMSSWDQRWHVVEHNFIICVLIFWQRRGGLGWDAAGP